MAPDPKRIATGTLVSAFSALTALVLCDVALGVATGDSEYARRRQPPFGDVFSPDVIDRMRRGPHRTAGENVFDAELGWSQAPSSSADDPVRINDVGARSRREYEPLPPDGVRRIVCYGESYTFGAEVADGEEWPARLEAALDDTEVVNFGVGAYGQDQALLRFRRRGLLGADVALMGIMLENIGRNVNRYRNRYARNADYPLSKPRFVLEGEDLVLVPQPFGSQRELFDAALDGSILARLSEHEYWSDDVPVLEFSSLSRRLTYDGAALRRRRVKQLWLEPESEPFRVSVALLEAFCREARAAGARFAGVVIFAPRDAMARVIRGDDHLATELCAELDRRGVPYVDTAPDLAMEHALSSHPQDLFTGTHPSPFAHGRIAEMLIADLRARGVL